MIRTRCSEDSLRHSSCKDRRHERRNWRQLLPLIWQDSNQSISAAISSVSAAESNPSSTYALGPASPPQTNLDPHHNAASSAPNSTVSGTSGSPSSTNISASQHPGYISFPCHGPLDLLFGVEHDMEQRHVQPIDLKTHAVQHDSDFIWRLTESYKSSRGLFRLCFSVFQLDTCIFRQVSDLSRALTFC